MSKHGENFPPFFPEVRVGVGVVVDVCIRNAYELPSRQSHSIYGLTR